MISFKQFITEEQKFDIEQFKKDCDFTLSKLNGSGFLWHGNNEKIFDFKIKKWKPRTGPKDSSLELHNGFNKFSQSTFGVEARNWLFTSGFNLQASIYSKDRNPYIIFPIGQFEWLCSADKDFFDLNVFQTKLVYQIQDQAKKELSSQEKEKLSTNLVLQKLPHVKWFFNEHLDKCIQSKHEIMIKCDKFYIINQNGPVGEQIKKLTGVSF